MDYIVVDTERFLFLHEQGILLILRTPVIQCYDFAVYACTIRVSLTVTAMPAIRAAYNGIIQIQLHGVNLMGICCAYAVLVRTPVHDIVRTGSGHCGGASISLVAVYPFGLDICATVSGSLGQSS